MGHLRFTDLQTRPLEVLDLTSLTLDEFRRLAPPFEAAFQTHMAQWRFDGQPRMARRYITYKNCPLPTPEDRLLFILTYLKTYPLQVVQGRLFGIDQSKANQWIHVLLVVLQRRDSWLIPGYDANFALLVVAGSNRRETLARMTGLLDAHLQIKGDGALHTNLEPVVGLLTLMQALPPATEFRTDTSLLWMAPTAVIMAQKQEVLSLVPPFPRHLEPHDPAQHTRLLRTVLEKAFVHPSRLLTYYLRRLMASAPRPLSTLEVLLALAEELGVEIFEEEQQQWRALHEATAALWTALSASHERYAALVHAAAAGNLEQSADYEELHVSLQAVHPGIERQESVQLLRYLLGWLSIEIPAVTALIRTIESTQLHACLAVPLDHDLSLPYPPFLKDEAVIGRLHHLLTAHLRPVVLQHNELLSPMEATIFLRPEPHAPPSVQIGSEIRAGQPLALLEAMKMFTEVTSPIDGILEDILVEDGHGVKTGTPLFKIAAHDTSVVTMDDAMQRIIDRAFRNYFGALFPFRDSEDISHRLKASWPISQDGGREMGKSTPGM